MSKVPKEIRLKNIVCQGLYHLHDQLAYGQSNVVNKLKMLGHSVSTASLSNIKNNKAVGLTILSAAAKGMEILVLKELNMVFEPQIQDFQVQQTADWQATIVPEKLESDKQRLPYMLHTDGRVTVQEKTEFIHDARQEVMEIGVRLHSFSSYFISQNDGVYRKHILALLQKGVNIKGYLLDPDSNEARLYFDDRAKVQSREKDSIAEIKKVIEQLRSLSSEFEAMKLPGKFEIYLYKHVPYGLFFAVDATSENGKMMVSPYLYGVRRANCPVLELTRKDQPQLFRLYWESMQMFMEEAQKLI